MTHDTDALGGRLVLLDPAGLSEPQQMAYCLIEHFAPAKTTPFEVKDENGHLIGPFNPALYSPEMSVSVLEWQLAEVKHTSLAARTREVIILAVGAVWQADYELYAHAAVARKVGLSENAIAQICAGAFAADLSDADLIAQQYATQLTAHRRVKDLLFAKAEAIFGPRGLVDIANLVGAYQAVCGILTSFAIPRPK